MRILITNDDGIHAPALEALHREFAPLGEVVVVVPDRDQSATSHSLTLHRPLRIREVRPGWFSVDGTPTDCVLIAYHGLLEHPPEMVVSGINHGPNMGEDVFYSGTVSAAIEGAMQGSLAIAASLVTREPSDFVAPARFVRRVTQEAIARGFGGKRVLNVNIPFRPWDEVKGVKLTRLGTRVYSDTLIRKEDPRGRPYYWIGGLDPVWQPVEGTDFHAVHEGYVSVTPLAMDLTDVAALAGMDSWQLTP
ncbi:MAG: 5'/3'-nucleotidase SurE [Candidatus Eisenbacteria bacterium]|uniref:5'-nucleotidase SurE n=1 Tax=Eiseniibacteriota bacterium TaxID=2212470 RepID=A0A849SMS8_UNCEI|nr:5'/3'-nucleotidase SurE [Candidatus Eisenbacteria bacterium]